jgi:hypothetical protein
MASCRNNKASTKKLTCHLLLIENNEGAKTKVRLEMINSGEIPIVIKKKYLLPRFAVTAVDENGISLAMLPPPSPDDIENELVTLQSQERFSVDFFLFEIISETILKKSNVIVIYSVIGKYPVEIDEVVEDKIKVK